jgi:NAD(P)-dependent dehydrogenase (short-subunit alcohol dehydrogenase family)
MPNQDVQRLAERYPTRRVLITGATSELGEALALEFARHGSRIGVSGRNPDKVGVAARKVCEVRGDALRSASRSLIAASSRTRRRSSDGPGAASTS